MSNIITINKYIKVSRYDKIELLYRKEEPSLPKIILGQNLKLYDEIKVIGWNPTIVVNLEE